MSASIKGLRDCLAGTEAGPVPDSALVEQLLANCWDNFSGHGDGGMEAYKLLGRTESLRWQPPILHFVIERHGGTVKGSTRAELQHWQIDLDKRLAQIMKEGHRQLEPMAPRVSIKEIADEIAALVVGGMVDPRIRRFDDGSAKVLLSNIFPTHSAFRRTVKSRRERLMGYVAKKLNGLGWVPLGSDSFGPSSK